MNIRLRRLAWLLAAIPVLIGIARLRFDVDVLNLLPDEVPAVQGLKIYQENFANARELVISVRAPDSDTAEWSARTLAESLRASTGLVAHAAWQAPWLEHPEQAAEMVGYLWLNRPPEKLSALTNRLAGPHAGAVLESTLRRLSMSMSPEEIGRLSYDPFQLMSPPDEGADSSASFGQDQEMFTSSDGAFRVVLVEAAEELKSYRACMQWLNGLRQQINAWRAEQEISPGVVVRLTGRPAFMSEIAGSMERDITRSVLGTLGVIAVLFWIAHRSWRPLLWLLLLLVLVLVSAFALGGLLLGNLNVVSAGFAAILLGLAVDYALVLYQEHRAAPHESVDQLQRKLRPSILGSVVTTAGAFAVLNCGGLPGLGQLGTLVAVGVVAAGLIMFFLFLPPLIRAEIAGRIPLDTPRASRSELRWPAPLIWLATVAVVVVAPIAIWQRGVSLDPTSDALRLRTSEAFAALDEIRTNIDQPPDPLWLLVAGRDEQEVGRRIDAAAAILERAKENGSVTDYTMPTDVWPRPENQRANRPTLTWLIQQEARLAQNALDHGFTSNSLALTEKVFAVWRQAAASTNTFWPGNPMSRWILEKFTARQDGTFFALGLIYAESHSDHRAWASALPQDGVWLAGWDQLGAALLAVVKRDLQRVLIPLGLLLVLSLWLAFRRFSEVILSLATLLFSALGLLTIMAVAGWSWNLMNLMAIPLLLGTGIDYSLHMQLALRRHQGDIARTRRIVGRALLLCAASTFAGFGSLSWSGNAGLATLGQVCATGVAATALTSVFLLPVWWRRLGYGGANPPDDPSGSGAGSAQGTPSRLRRPSTLYRAGFWRFGMSLSRRLSPGTADFIADSAAGIYTRCNPARRQVVLENVLPAFADNPTAARAATDALFKNFARKLLDLWRYENGLPIDPLIQAWTGWEHFTQAHSQGRGVLLVTPHLGNWEFGAPLLARKGVPPLVLTMVEPDIELTEMRQNSRARWGIETLVVGQDPFSFVEVIRRLEAGAAVALLIDRPPPSSAVTVELFGRPFSASIAAAELARASGCALIPVYLPRTGGGYAAHMLPQIPYDRQLLGRRPARQALTQQMMRIFEPLIKLYITQWYHFVPVWPGAEPVSGSQSPPAKREA